MDPFAATEAMLILGKAGAPGHAEVLDEAQEAFLWLPPNHVVVHGRDAAPKEGQSQCFPSPGSSRANEASFPPRAESTKPALPFCGSWTCFGLLSIVPARTSLNQKPRHIPQQFGKCISSINDNRLFKQQLKHSDCFLVCSH